jgi:hypothetical protein
MPIYVDFKGKFACYATFVQPLSEALVILQLLKAMHLHGQEVVQTHILTCYGLVLEPTPNMNRQCRTHSMPHGCAGKRIKPGQGRRQVSRLPC